MDLRKSPSFSNVIGSFFTGFGSGLIGSVVFGVVILLSWSIVGDILLPVDVASNEFGVSVETPKPHDLFLFFIILAMFLSISAASMAYVALSSITQEIYNKRATVLTHSFFANLIFLVLMIPVYLAFSGFDVQGVIIAAMIHVFVSATFTFSIQEMLAEKKYLAVKLYSGSFTFLSFSALVFSLIGSNTSVLSFIALPIVYGFFSLFKTLTESIYIWFYQTYGVDALNIDTRYGQDFQDELQQKK